MVTLLQTWYVSFRASKDPRSDRRYHARKTRTFVNETEAKRFASELLAGSTVDVSAGTINPHQPKRVIASTNMTMWLRDEHA